MKKIIVVLAFLFFTLSFVTVDATPLNLEFCSSESNLATEYLNASKEYKFNENQINYDLIADSFKLLETQPNLCLASYVYNIYGEIQYILIENQLESKYLIYDLMLNEALEYSLTSISTWSSIGKWDNVKIYYSPNNTYFIENDKIIKTQTLEEMNNVEIEFTLNNRSSEIDLTDIEIDEFENRIIHSKYDINNYQYFQYVDLKRELVGSDPYIYINGEIRYNTSTRTASYNNGKSCTIVAATILLGYYDTFYNDNIIPNHKEVYMSIRREYKSDDEDEYYGVFDDVPLEKTVSVPNADPLILNKISCPTEYLHDNLYYFSRMVYNNNSPDPDNLCDIIPSYLYTVNLSSSFSTNYLLFNINVLDKLNNNIPVIMGFLGETVYYEVGGTILGHYDALSSHAVVAYGYEETTIGRLYHVNMGWSPKYNDSYLNVNLFGEYFWMNYNNQHVCSDNYHYNIISDVTSDLINISYCPACNSFEDFFESDDTYLTDLDHDYFHLITDNNKIFRFSHEYDMNDYLVHNSQYHYKLCHFCGEEELDGLGNSALYEHNFSIRNSNNNLTHNIKCIDCGYNYNELHLLSHYECLNDDYCRKYCNICKMYYETVSHVYSAANYSELRHKYTCNNCGHEYFENHILDNNNDCIVCNYHHSYHTYTYTQFNSRKHQKSCYCGISTYEGHTFVDYHGALKCTYCGYETDDFVPINSNRNKMYFNGINENIILYINLDKFETKEDDKNE